MTEIKVEVHWHTHGFNEEQFSPKEWKKITDEFLAKHNEFADASNQIIDRLNEAWDNLSMMRDLNPAIAEKMAETMGIRPDATYGDWFEKWYIQIVDAINKSHPFGRLEGMIFRDGDTPLFGARFKKHPEWTMDFTITMV